MLEKLYHLFRLKSPREMRELERRFYKDLRKNQLDLAEILAERLSGDLREERLKQVAEARKREGL